MVKKIIAITMALALTVLCVGLLSSCEFTSNADKAENQSAESGDTGSKESADKGESAESGDTGSKESADKGESAESGDTGSKESADKGENAESGDTGSKESADKGESAESEDSGSKETADKGESAEESGDTASKESADKGESAESGDAGSKESADKGESAESAEKSTDKTGGDKGVSAEETQKNTWQTNENLPPMNDAYFYMATRDTEYAEYEPLQTLATQVVAGTNTVYLCYNAYSEQASREFKIITVYTDLSGNCEILKVSDFAVGNYTTGNGADFPQSGLCGAKTVNENLPNFLDEDIDNAFDAALNGLTGVSYEPVCLLATKNAGDNGTDYAILAKGTLVTQDPTTMLFVVTINVNGNGSATLQNICGIDLTAI